METVGLMRMAACEGLLAQRQLDIERQIYDRVDQIRTGLLKCPSDIMQGLQRFDPLLRGRYCFQRHSLVVERYAAPDQAWILVMAWPDDERGFPVPLQTVLGILAASDMQRVGGKEWITRKREAAATVRERTERASTEKVLEAVDSLSSKRIKQFVAVEEAIQSGEQIRPLGDDARRMEQISAPALPSAKAISNDAKMARNPGMHPRIYKRRR